MPPVSRASKGTPVILGQCSGKIRIQGRVIFTRLITQALAKWSGASPEVAASLWPRLWPRQACDKNDTHAIPLVAGLRMLAATPGHSLNSALGRRRPLPYLHDTSKGIQDAAGCTKGTVWLHTILKVPSTPEGEE
jgi:hypothetical protein